MKSTRPSVSMPTAAEIFSIAIGVFMSPGMMAFTRMPCLALPMARVWVSALSPAFDVL